MISPVDGVEILRKWKRERTLISLFVLNTGDFASRWESRIRAADNSLLEVEMAESNDTRRFNLTGALFDIETPEELPFDPVRFGRFSSFLFIRLSDGLPLIFAVPELLN